MLTISIDPLPDQSAITGGEQSILYRVAGNLNNPGFKDRNGFYVLLMKWCKYFSWLSYAIFKKPPNCEQTLKNHLHLNSFLQGGV
jgi:hypothetical protein